MPERFLLEIDFKLFPAKRREFNKSLDSLIGRQETGQIRAFTYEDRDDNEHILLVSEWADRTAVDTYVQSDSYRALLGCLMTLGEVSDCRIVDLPVPADTVSSFRAAHRVRTSVTGNK